jgi:hypothetical protein
MSKSKTPAKVVIEISPKGWSTKVIADDGSKISSRKMKLTNYGAHGTTPGDIYTDLNMDDDQMASLAEAIYEGNHYDVAEALRELNAL